MIVFSAEDIEKSAPANLWTDVMELALKAVADKDYYTPDRMHVDRITSYNVCYTKLLRICSTGGVRTMIRKEINKISEVGKALISVEGNPGVALNHVVELLEADTNQSLSFAKAINITEDSTRFQVFNGTAGLSTKTKIRMHELPLTAGYSPKMLGRCFRNNFV